MMRFLFLRALQTISTSISNPFAKINYTAPDGTKITYPRSLNDLPKPPKAMKPHPYGVEFGTLQRMLQKTNSRTLLSFLTNEFSSVGTQSAKEICKISKVEGDAKPQEMDRATIEKIIKAMQTVRIQRPPLD
jgi:DNA topoisomerase-6 subunit B